MAAVSVAVRRGVAPALAAAPASLSGSQHNLPAPHAPPAPSASSPVADDGGDAEADVDYGLGGSSATASMGRDLLAGPLLLVTRGLLTPLAEILRRRLPADRLPESSVNVAVNVGGALLAAAAAHMCGRPAEQLGALVAQVPVLGSSSIMGRILRLSLGQAVSQYIETSSSRRAPSTSCSPTGDIFMDTSCALCLSSFETGTSVAALSCGHACLCHDCSSLYFSERDDCPTCRSSPVRVLLSIRC
mmetsp:Transcript_11787/g.26287  ORF Transcript_11787/g.26287 Transcript_11787/m.26287 type:complete len:245 (+) Transcript_11787:83-817(+)